MSMFYLDDHLLGDESMIESLIDLIVSYPQVKIFDINFDYWS